MNSQPAATITSGQQQEAEALESDVCFILTSAFLIFTMQSGYGLLGSGTMSRKNEVNLLLKNAVNIMCGSLAFWVYGFAFSSRDADLAKLKLSEQAAAVPTLPTWRSGGKQFNNPQSGKENGGNSCSVQVFFVANIL